MSSCYFKELSCNETSWGITESCSWYSLLIQVRHISLQFYDVHRYAFYPCCLYTGNMVEDLHYVRKCNIISYLWAICHTGAWKTWLSAVLQEPKGSDGVNSFHILLGRQQHSGTVSTDTRCRHKKTQHTLQAWRWGPARWLGREESRCSCYSVVGQLLQASFQFQAELFYQLFYQPLTSL